MVSFLWEDARGILKDKTTNQLDHEANELSTMKRTVGQGCTSDTKYNSCQSLFDLKEETQKPAIKSIFMLGYNNQRS